MTVEPEHILGSLMELRDYDRLESKVSEYIREQGWSYVVGILRWAESFKSVVPGWDTPLRKGILRDGIIALLNLQEFQFLDTVLLDEFGYLESNNLEDLRLQARKRAVVLAQEQTKRGNTFFMNLEAMKENELAVLVPEAIEKRTREIQSLGDSPNLYEVYSTYYGFNLLTSGGGRFNRPGVPADVSRILIETLGEMGGVKALRSKQLKFSPLAFRKCSPSLTVILWNMLRISLSSRKLRVKALKKLGDLGDSRPLDLIHSLTDIIESGGNPYGAGDYVLCLGKIGHPSSFSRVQEYRIKRGYRHIGFAALSGIRHPEVEPVLESLVTNPPKWRAEQLNCVTALHNTRSPKWLPFYEKMKLSKHKSVSEAAENARRNVRPEGTY